MTADSRTIREYLLTYAISHYNEDISQQEQEDFLTTYDSAEALMDFLWEMPDSGIRPCEVKEIIHDRARELQDEVYEIVVQYVQNAQSRSPERLRQNSEIEESISNTQLVHYSRDLEWYAVRWAVVVFDELDRQDQQDFLTEFHDAQTLLDKIWGHIGRFMILPHVIGDTIQQELTDRREEIYQTVVDHVKWSLDGHPSD